MAFVVTRDGLKSEETLVEEERKANPPKVEFVEWICFMCGFLWMAAPDAPECPKCFGDDE